MTNLIIPLEGTASNAHQSFNITLGDIGALFVFDYNYIASQWTFSISVNNELIVSGAVLAINADILRNWNIASTFGSLVCVGSEPTLDNIGVDCNLMWMPPNE